ANDVHERGHLRLLVVGYQLIDLLDQTGQGATGLLGEDHDDGASTQLSPIAQLFADHHAVVRGAAAFHDLKRRYALADREPTLQPLGAALGPLGYVLGLVGPARAGAQQQGGSDAPRSSQSHKQSPFRNQEAKQHASPLAKASQ